MKKVSRISHRFLRTLSYLLVMAVVSGMGYIGLGRKVDTTYTLDYSLGNIAHADSPHTDGGDGADGGDGGGGGGGGGGGDGDSDDAGCFVAGTKVRLADGSDCSIERIQPGAVVRGQYKDFVVVRTMVHDGVHDAQHSFSREPLKKIRFSDGSTLWTVDGHPIYKRNTQSAIWQWSNIASCGVGTEVLNAEGAVVTVASIEIHFGKTPTLYNLELMVGEHEDRSYYANGILVRDTQHVRMAVSTIQKGSNHLYV